MLLPLSGLEDHPDGSGDLNAIVNGNWQVLEEYFNPAANLTGSQTTTNVTASAAVFTDEHIGATLEFASGETGIIQAGALNSTPSTACVLSTSQTVTSGTPFKIYRTDQVVSTALARALMKITDADNIPDGSHPRWSSSRQQFTPGVDSTYGITAGQILYGGGVGAGPGSSADFSWNDTLKALSVNGDIIGLGARIFYCYVATTANITLSGEQTIDGFPVTAGDYVLVKDQASDYTKNGVWICAVGAWRQIAHVNGNYEHNKRGFMAFVRIGTANGQHIYTCYGQDIIEDIGIKYLSTTGAWPMNGHLTLNAGDPVSGDHAARKAYVDAADSDIYDYVDAVAAGVRSVKSACRAVETVSNVDISSPAPFFGWDIDGVVLVDGDRILLTAQTDPSENGIWIFTGVGLTPLARPDDFNSTTVDPEGSVVAITEGTSYEDTLWLLTTNAPITIDTTNLTWAILSFGGEANTASNLGAGAQVFKSKVALDLQFRSFTAGQGLEKTQNTNEIDYKMTDNALAVAHQFVIDGGGAVITTGVKGYLEIPFGMTIERVTLMADVSGSIVIDIWKDTYANFPPTVADTITAAAKPTIAAAVKAQDATLTGWTTAVAAGDILAFNVDSVSTITKLTISIKGKKT